MDKKTLGLICLLANILAPVLTAFLVVGLGSLIYGVSYREKDPRADKYYKNGLLQLIVSASSVVVIYCCLIGLGWLLIGLLAVFLYVIPLGLYIWSVIDAVNLFKESQEPEVAG